MINSICESNSDDNAMKRLSDRLHSKYGLLMTLEDVAELFKYKTVGAVRKANERRVLPVTLYKFEGKAGLYARTDEAVLAITNMELHVPNPPKQSC